MTEGLWYDELVKNKHVRKRRGGKAELLRGPDDTTEAFTGCFRIINRICSSLRARHGGRLADRLSLSQWIFEIERRSNVRREHAARAVRDQVAEP